MFECKVDKEDIWLSVGDTDNAELMTELVTLNLIMLSRLAADTEVEVGKYKNILVGMIDSIPDDTLTELHTLGQEADGDA